MNVNPCKNQTDVMNVFDFIRKIKGSVLYEQVGILDRVMVPPRQKTVHVYVHDNLNILSFVIWVKFQQFFLNWTIIAIR